MINKRIERKKALDFSDKLLSWHRNINRRLPWVGIKDAYRIWLSEIILQQTRVEQGLPYYQQFIRRFPTVRSMAEATEDDVLRLWQGLGYYSRARNMYHTAVMVVKNYRGLFPTAYDELIKLKGIGAYSAAA
ncbi:MAG: A/G-specific adenine glycosylase, partial [Bacteroidota bacterium]